jgi:secreted PhoX family phosphatase
VTKLTQEAATGNLTATATKAVDVSSIDGLYRTCAGSITPWGTHISAEEAQVDARTLETLSTWTGLTGHGRWGELKMMGKYLGVDLTGANDAAAVAFQTAYSAYFNGYAVELKVDANGAPTLKKHYAMGRLGMELAYVMPDQKTVFLTDDVTNGMLGMFVADTAGDLEAGTLYAMRVYQTSPVGGATFTGDIEWISLGHASSDEIKALIHPAGGAARIKFADMFDVGTVTNNACDAGYTAVRGNGDNTNLECLKVKAGMDLAASRLETRRYAVIKGATAEMTKEEGLTYDPETNRLYIGISDITSSMGTQTGGTDHINVAANGCGAVFALNVGPIADGNGTKITDYAALNWYPLVSGVPMTYPTGSAYAGNTCAVNGLASPDNVTYLPKYQMLMIGEDTGKHQNDAMWAYHVPSGKLTRVLTTPYGSEVTSPYWVPNLGDHGYLITAIQHPYTESDNTKISDAENTGRDSYIGVMGPFPAFK